MKSPTTKIPRTTHNGAGHNTFTFDSGAHFANNDEYASKGITFDILAVALELGKGYEGGDRWALTVKADGREVETMTLGSNPRRDEQLRAAQAFLESHDAIKSVRLKKSGNAYYLESPRA